MTPYQKRAYAQGLAWVNGESKHNTIDGECTPDFSCCVPQLFEQDRSKRVEAFNDAAKRHDWPLITNN